MPCACPGAEVGFYAGCVETWQAVLCQRSSLQLDASTPSSSPQEHVGGTTLMPDHAAQASSAAQPWGTPVLPPLTERSEKGIRQLRELVAGFPLDDPQVGFNPNLARLAARDAFLTNFLCRMRSSMTCWTRYEVASRQSQLRWGCCRITCLISIRARACKVSYPHYLVHGAHTSSHQRETNSSAKFASRGLRSGTQGQGSPSSQPAHTPASRGGPHVLRLIKTKIRANQTCTVVFMPCTKHFLCKTSE